MEKKYSAGIVSKLFWAVEAKKTAILFRKGMKRSEIKEKIVEENIYQALNTSRATRMFGNIYSRIDSLGIQLTEWLSIGDFEEICVINMISIMLTERLFADFMYEIFRNKLILGDYELKDNDFNSFIADKKLQSDEIAEWTDETIGKIRQTFYKMLIDGGFAKINNNGVREIVKPILSYEVENYLKDNGMEKYLYSMTGEM